MKNMSIITLSLSIFFLVNCTKDKNTNSSTSLVDSTIKVQDSLLLIKDTIPSLPLITYKFVSPPKQNRYKYLIEEYDNNRSKNHSCLKPTR